MDPIVTSATLPPRPASRNDKLMEAARELEASFLSEMLESAGYGKSRETFGGGAGEDQFQSFLLREHAKAIVDHGGVGLAQSLFEALKLRDGGA